VSTFERIHNTIEAEVWTGDGHGVARLVMFAGPHVVRGFELDADTQKPTDRLVFLCAKSDTYLTLNVGDALAAEPDGEGYYPIRAAILAAEFRPVAPATDDESLPADETPRPVTPAEDDLVEALDALERDTR